jgi:cell division protein FtsQ
MEHRWYVTWLVISVTILFMCWLFSDRVLEISHERFPIKQVEVFGNLHFTHQYKVEDSINSLLNRGFFLVDIVKVKQNLLTLPWVSDVVVQRKWPDRLMITLVEHSPLAIWNDTAIITRKNTVIYPDQLPYGNKLPKFFSAQQAINCMLDTYLAVMLKVTPLGLSVANLKQMQDNGLRAELSNGIEIILGEDDFSIKLSRFGLAYKNVIKLVETKVAYVDLRYINGIAVGWR